MNHWDISETEASVIESDGTRLSYEGVANSESNIPPSFYQTEKQESVVFPPPSFSPDEKWVKDYMEQFGQEPSVTIQSWDRKVRNQRHKKFAENLQT